MLTYTPAQVLELLVSKQAGRSQRAFADEIGVTQQYLCDVLKGRKPPCGTAILKYLDLEQTVIPKQRNRGVRAA